MGKAARVKPSIQILIVKQHEWLIDTNTHTIPSIQRSITSARNTLI